MTITSLGTNPAENLDIQCSRVIGVIVVISTISNFQVSGVIAVKIKV